VHCVCLPLPPFLLFCHRCERQTNLSSCQGAWQETSNVFYDDQGYLDLSHEFDMILHNIDGGTILRKRKHPAPPLGDVDPELFVKYNEADHGMTLRKLLDLSHLPTHVQQQVY
jgi:hypothetical protein